MSLTTFAKGGSSGGGHASSSARSSSSSRSSGSSSSSSKATPGSTIKTSSGASVKTSSAKPTNSKYSSTAGVVGADGYTPRFSGYSAPAGSVVYYPDHSFIDYLPWIYLFSQHSPSSDTATIVQPDGKQVVAPPEPGVDGMAIFSWILIILLVSAGITGVVYFVNKLTKGDKKNELN